MKKSIFILFLLLFATDVFAQKNGWDTLQTDDGELVMKMPANCYSSFYNRDGIIIYESDSRNRYQLAEMRQISCYRDRTLMSVEIYENAQAKSAARILREKLKINGNESKIADKFYAVEQTDETEDYISNRRVVAGEKRVYVISAAARGAANETMRTFLDSLQFVDGKTRSAPADESGVLISSLKSVEPEYVSESDAAKKLTAPRADRQASDDSTLEKLIVLSKPHPSYTDSARKKRTKGTIVLRLTFGAAGAISKIEVVRELPDGLLREAVIAALRIKFLPAERNGEPQAVTKLVEYNFGIY